MAPLDSRDYVFWCGGTRFFISTVTKSSLGSISWATVSISSHPAMCETQCGISTLPANTETLTQCWSNSGPTSATLAQHQTSTGSTPRVCWAAGLAVHTDGGEYKPTPTQCLLNVGPASPMLASIHSALVSTSFWRYMHAGSTGKILWTKAGLMLAHRLWRWPTFSVAPNTTR